VVVVLVYLVSLKFGWWIRKLEMIVSLVGKAINGFDAGYHMVLKQHTSSL
jgi:hypothetical protein